MLTLLIISLIAGSSFSGEGAIVMLPGIPADPWGSLSENQLEEMWTYGVEGYQVTRSGWSGYLLKGPDGTGSFLEELGETLETDVIVADSSLWARSMQLIWNTNVLSNSWLISDFLGNAPVFPVRISHWLESGSDTLIISLPVSNSVFLWTGSFDRNLSHAAWRGIGTEVIPCGSGYTEALVTCVVEGSPSDIFSLEYVALEEDIHWSENWAHLLSIADSLVTRQLSTGLIEQTSLVWIRGTGGELFIPWSMIPSPSPAAVASREVEPMVGLIPTTPVIPPGVLEVVMPGNAGSGARAAYAAALLERIVARMALESGVTCKAVFTETGGVILCLEGSDWNESTALAEILDELTPIIFTSPERELLHNAAIKAGIPPMNQHDTIELLARVTGFLN